jgi:aminoglycoside phosphotransferase (APT) family kinase protein
MRSDNLKSSILCATPDVELSARLVEQIVGESVDDARQITQGVMNWKYEVTTIGGNKFIVRVYPHSRSNLVHFEPDLIRRFRSNGVLSPEVIGDSRTGPYAPWEYCVYRMLPGASLHDRHNVGADDLSRIISEVYQQLILIASIPFQGFGDLVTAGNSGSSNWTDFIDQAFTDGLKVALHLDLLEPRVRNHLLNVQQHIARLIPPERSSLAWADISPSNIIIDNNNRLVGLIDFEGVLAAEIELNFGYVQAAFDGTDFCSELFDNWSPDRMQRSRADIYTIVRALRIIRYAGEPLPIGSTRDPIESFLPGFMPALERLQSAVF